MDFDKPKVYGDTSITDGLVSLPYVMVSPAPTIPWRGRFPNAFSDEFGEKYVTKFGKKSSDQFGDEPKD